MKRVTVINIASKAEFKAWLLSYTTRDGESYAVIQHDDTDSSIGFYAVKDFLFFRVANETRPR